MSIRRRDGEVQELRSLEAAGGGYQGVTSIAPSSHSKWLQDDSPLSLGVGSLIAISGALLGLFLYICICRSQSPSERVSRAAMIRERRRWRQERQREQERSQAILKARDDPKKREQVFSNNLVVQKIIYTDNEGNLTLGDVDDDKGDITDGTEETESNPPPSHHAEGHGEDSNTCVICFEPFRVGDLVAWSKHSSVSEECIDEAIEEDKAETSLGNLTVSSSFPEKNAPNKNPRCLHVFHKDCIGEWLLDTKHDDCPFCRTLLLPAESWCEPDKDDNNYSSSTAVFVIIQGLVSQARRAKNSLIQHASQLGQQHQTNDIGNKQLESQDADVEVLEAGENGSKDPPGIRMVRSASDPFLAGAHTSSDTSSCDSDEEKGDKRAVLFRNLPSIFNLKRSSQEPSHSDDQQPTLVQERGFAQSSEPMSEEQLVDSSVLFCQPCPSNDSSFSSQYQNETMRDTTMNPQPDLQLTEGERPLRLRTMSSNSI